MKIQQEIDWYKQRLAYYQEQINSAIKGIKDTQERIMALEKKSEGKKHG